MGEDITMENTEPDAMQPNITSHDDYKQAEDKT